MLNPFAPLIAIACRGIASTASSSQALVRLNAPSRGTLPHPPRPFPSLPGVVLP
jgi:hypothetical protein